MLKGRDRQKRRAIIGDDGKERARPPHSAARSKAGGRRSGERPEGEDHQDQTEAQARSPETLELLKRIHDHGDMVAGLTEYSNLDTVTQWLLAERWCAEEYAHGVVGVRLHLRRIRSCVTHARDFVLSVGFPLGSRNRNQFKNGSRRDERCLASLWNGHELRDDSVLVGIREPVYMDQRVNFRVWLSLKRLELPNFPQPVDNTGERPAWQGRFIGPDALGIFGLVREDGKLMLVTDGPGAGNDKRRYDVVESAPEVMYEVADDGAECESYIREIGGRKINGHPAVFVDLADPRSIRATLLHGGVEFSLERFKVYARPCDLCLGLGKVESECHRFPSGS